MQFKWKNKEQRKRDAKRTAAKEEHHRRVVEQEACELKAEWHDFFAIKPVALSQGGDEECDRIVMFETVQRRARFSWEPPLWQHFCHWEYRDPKDAMVDELKNPKLKRRQSDKR